MMEITTVTRPSANDEGVCGMFMNLFRRQRPALARLARNSNSYQHPMAKAVNSSPMTSATSATSTLDAAISQVHNIPVSACMPDRLYSIIQLKVSSTTQNSTFTAE